MDAALFLLLQAAAASPPERIDLTLPAATGGCIDRSGDDIVVCGGRANPYRLAPPVERPVSTLIPKAETKLVGGKAVGAVEAEGATMPNGTQSNRVMARIRLPF